MNKYRPIEGSFQEIRAKTGNTDVRLLVEKFMNREPTYAQLLTAVKAYEQKYDELRKVNHEKLVKMNDIKIANDSRKILDRPLEDNPKDIDKFEKQLTSLEETQDLAMEKEEHEYALGVRSCQQLVQEEE